MDFASKTRAVVWAIVALLLFLLCMAMFTAKVFGVADIQWIEFVGICIVTFVFGMLSPDDPLEKEVRDKKAKRARSLR